MFLNSVLHFLEFDISSREKLQTFDKVIRFMDTCSDTSFSFVFAYNRLDPRERVKVIRSLLEKPDRTPSFLKGERFLLHTLRRETRISSFRYRNMIRPNYAKSTYGVSLKPYQRVNCNIIVVIR